MMDKLDALLGMEGKIVILKPYLLKWQSCVCETRSILLL